MSAALDIFQKKQTPLNLTRSEAREIFDYRDGCLYWRIRPSTKVRIGDIVGNERLDGYRQIKYAGIQCLAHRLIYLWHFGDVPECLDHIDNNPRNNRIENLRPATIAQNNRNRGKQTNNTSGFKGVSWCKRDGKYGARIQINGEYISLGNYTDPKLAHEAYKAAAIRLHGEFARAACGVMASV